MSPQFASAPENGPISFCVPQQADGWRLDRTLGLLLNAAADSGTGGDALRALAVRGVRTRRRLCACGLVRVQGRPAAMGLKVRAGQEITLRLPAAATPPDPAERQLPFVVHTKNNLAALFKPAGLHTTALPGTAAPSLEAMLPDLLPHCAENSFPRLLNRLDLPTSGLVLAALNADRAQFWRQAENTGRISKRYLAIVEGQPRSPFSVRMRLDTDNRSRTRVCHTDCADMNRHTSVTPLAPLLPAASPGLFTDIDLPLTLVGCCIRKGARHQIRAHLAAAGYPLLGDTLYGAAAGRGTGLFLHHASVRLTGFTACCPPVWLPLLPETVGRIAAQWLRG